MIIILPLDGIPAEHFKNYDDLFECIIDYENQKHPEDASRDWNFIIYSPQEVVALYALSQESCDAMEEALEENLPLIEICAGDYKNPLYIVLTPNVDMGFLKKKWCTDYCTYHNLVVKGS